MVGDPIILDPGNRLLELHLMGCVVKEKKQGKGEDKFDEGKDKSHHAEGRKVILIDKQEDNGTQDREKRHETQNGKTFHRYYSFVQPSRISFQGSAFSLLLILLTPDPRPLTADHCCSEKYGPNDIVSHNHKAT